MVRSTRLRYLSRAAHVMHRGGTGQPACRRYVATSTDWSKRVFPTLWTSKPTTKQDISAADEYKRRTEAFFAGTLPPYTETGETSSQTLARLSGYAVMAIRQAADLVPAGVLGRTVLRSISAADFVHKYGVHGLAGFYFRQDVMEAAQLIYTCAQKIDATAGQGGVERGEEPVSSDSQLGMRDMIGGLYYKVAENAGMRGCQPRLQADQYGTTWVNEDKRNMQLLHTFLHHAPLALFFAYTEEAAEAQRLLGHQGYTLVVADIEEKSKEEPIFLLAAHRERKHAVVIVRGSHTALDWYNH